MKHLSIIICLLLSSQLYAQKYWESNFWRPYARKAKDSSMDVQTTYPNGAVRMSGRIVNGKPEGLWRFYDESGQLVVESEFSGKYQYHDTIGTVSRYIETGQSTNGIRSGVWTKKIYYYEGDSLICIVKTDYDSGNEQTFTANNELLSNKLWPQKKLRNRALSVGGLYFEAGVTHHTKDLQSNIDFFNSQLNTVSSIQNLGFSGSLAWNINGRYYVACGIDQMNAVRFKSNGSTMASINAESIHLLGGVDLARIDALDICPSLGFFHNDFSLRDTAQQELASHISNGLNLELCLRFNLINNRPIIPKGICTFALKGGYQIPFSKERWQATKQYTFNDRPIINNSGYYLALTVGFYLRNVMGQ